MTDDERRIFGAVSDLIYMLAISKQETPQAPPVRPSPSMITPDTKISDLIGDLRRASPE